MFILKNNPSLRRMSQIRRNFGATCTLKGIAVRRSLSVRSCFGAWCTNSYTSEKTTSNGEFIRTDTRARKSLVGDHYTQAQGRSMVEMLGVLAIIGVLSVGAIAGYSKAMMKYKLNQHAQAVNLLINNLLSIKDKLQYIPNGGTQYGTLFYKMNLLPDGIKYISNDNLEDIWFKGKIVIYYANGKYISDGVEVQNNFGGINFKFSPSAQGAEICRNIALAAKENADNLWQVEVAKYYNDTDKGYDYIGNLYGDKYCNNSDRKCLRDLDINKLSELCNACNEAGCNLYVLYK
mgnify:FL=1